MKKLIAILLSILMVLLIFASCNTDGEEKSSVADYYKKEDFKSITIGESTYQDVYNIAPVESMQTTSYGGFCQYPMENGGYIRIKFYGEELIVGGIEEVSNNPVSGVSSAEVSSVEETSEDPLIAKEQAVRQQIQQNLNQALEELYINGNDYSSIEFQVRVSALAAICDEIYLFYKEMILVKFSNVEKGIKEAGFYSEEYISFMTNDMAEFKDHFDSYCEQLEKIRDDGASVAADIYQGAFYGCATVPRQISGNKFFVAYSNMEQMSRLYHWTCLSYDTNQDGKYCYEEFLERFEKYADKEEIEKYLNEA